MYARPMLPNDLKRMENLRRVFVEAYTKHGIKSDYDYGCHRLAQLDRLDRDFDSCLKLRREKNMSAEKAIECNYCARIVRRRIFFKESKP